LKYLFEGLDQYDTPADAKVSPWFRWTGRNRWYFYFDNFRTFCLSGYFGKRGRLDMEHQVDFSSRNVPLIERCGGKLHVRGLNHLRDLNGRPVVIVSNHMSLLETGMLHALFRPYVDFSFVVKESLMHVPYFKDILYSLKAIPVTRSNPREDLRTMLTKGKEILSGGRSLVIFPQATRSEKFIPEHFNSIGVKLAKAANVPVVPMALKTNFISNGKLIRDLGPIHPERDVWFEIGAPMEVTGNGSEQQQAIVDFIQTRVDRWLQMDKEK